MNLGERKNECDGDQIWSLMKETKEQRGDNEFLSFSLSLAQYQ